MRLHHPQFMVGLATRKKRIWCFLKIDDTGLWQEDGDKSVGLDMPGPDPTAEYTKRDKES